MDSYKVVISPKALSQLNDMVGYIRYTLLNPIAAQSVWQDALDTRAQLSAAAGSLALCRNPALHSLGYRCISFLRHNYVMLYRVKDSTAYVDAIYHMQQDYENTFSKELEP